MSEDSISGVEQIEERDDIVVEMSVPAIARQTATVRIVAASLAASAGFDLVEVEDLRLGVGEAAGAVIEAADHRSVRRLRVTFRASRRRLDVVMELDASSDDGGTGAEAQQREPLLDELAMRILAVLVDRFELIAGRVHLTKSA